MNLEEIPGHDPIVALIPGRPRPEGMALGRYVRHDPRSLAYPVMHASAPKPVAILHERRTPILDQGNLGSCTGNAGTGMLGCEPFFDTTPVRGLSLNEAYAVKLYSDATKADDQPGSYPPMDTGSNGLAIATVLKNRGIIDRYEHAFSVSAALAALERAPFIFGTVWLSGMDQPDSKGFVSLSGKVEGGHEIMCREYEPGKTLSAGVLTFDNSWSDTWGDKGRFRMTVKQFTYLLKQNGDVTCPVPRA
jgi:hypothetical protein